jgi:hypothetical protein
VRHPRAELSYALPAELVRALAEDLADAPPPA